MSYCPNCGVEADAYQRYCIECGECLVPTDTTGEAQRGRQPRQIREGSQQRKRQPRHAARETQRDTRQPRQQPVPPKNRHSQATDGDGHTRRNILFGGLFVVGVAGLGVGVLAALDDDSPEETAEEFVQALGDGKFSEANALIHSDAAIDGAGAAADVISSMSGLDVIFDVTDISVVDSGIVREGDGQALVVVTVNIDAVIGDTDLDVGLEMRDDDGEWRVWNLAV